MTTFDRTTTLTPLGEERRWRAEPGGRLVAESFHTRLLTTAKPLDMVADAG